MIFMVMCFHNYWSQSKVPNNYSNDTIAAAGTVGDLSLGRRNITGFSAAESANPQ